MDTQKLRQRILDLAIRGKLVPQDPDDEPASVLLDRIRAEKERLIAEGKIKRPKARKSTDKSHYQQFTPPFDIPDSWEWVTIADISSDILYGVSESAKAEGSYKLLRITDIQNSGVSWGSVPYTEYDPNKVKQFLLQNGDLLFARTGATVGKSYLVESVPQNAIYASYLIRIRTVKEVLPEYLKLFFESGLYWTQITLGSVGIGQPNVNGTSLGQLILPIPPRSEQIRILSATSKILETITDISASSIWLLDLISVAKSKILDLAMQGKLVPQDPADEPAADMLRRINPKAKIITDNPHYPQLPDNWVLTTVDSVCDYGNSENVSVDDIDSSDWILELEDIEKDSGRIITQKSKHERTINGVRHRFVNGDVLYSKLRTYLNKVLVAQKDGYCTTELIPVKSYDCVIPEYLCAWLRSPFFLSYTAECCYGVKMPRLSTTDARKGIIPLPPINEQKRITQKLSKVSELLSSLSNSID